MLEIRLFGNPQISLDGKPLQLRLPSKCWALLAYLLLHKGEHVPRKAIAFALWPDEPAASARANLRRHLHLLQNELPAADVPWILADASTLTWNAAAPFECDAHDVLGALPEGELLPEESSDWIETERARFRAAVSKRLLDSALTARAQSRIDDAIALARRLHVIDPFREDVVRLLMTLHVERHDKSGALALYAALEKQLQDELEAAPSPETAALAAAIRSDDSPSLFLQNLPQYATELIDTARRVDEIAALLDVKRLVTVTGPGGIGKTRLSVAAAYKRLGRYPDGIVFVDLAPLEDAASLLSAVAQALRADEIRTIGALLRYLQKRTMLLVLDNCEHLVRACARFAEAVLQGAPSVRILATSREALGVHGESLWRTDGLGTADAVQLFATRMFAHDRSFVLDARREAIAARICSRLDGIPLAIELAAACARSLDLDTLEEQIDARVQTHQALQESMEWSYALLEAHEQSLLAALSVFSGDFSLAAAQAVGAALEKPGDVVDTLARLLDKSMIHLERSHGSTRYRLLQTIRVFAFAKLTGPERARLQHAHAQYYATLLEEGSASWLGPNQRSWLQATAAEMSNIEHALHWALQEGNDTGVGARIVASLWIRFELTGNQQDGLALVLRALPHAGGERIEAELQLGAGQLNRSLQRFDEAAAHFASSLRLFERCGDEARAAMAVHGMAMCNRTDPERALELVQRSLRMAEHSGAERQRALSLMNLAHLGTVLGAGDGIAYRKQAIAIIERAGDEYLLSSALHTIGLEHFFAADYTRARSFLERALALSKSINSRRLIAQALHDLGDVAAATGDLGAAKDYYTVSLHRSLEIDFKSGIAGSLEGLAAVHFALGDARKAATLLGGAGRLEHLPVATGYFQPQIDAATAATAQRIREALGDKTAQQWMNHGALLTTDELAELAISR